jgi:hypothetical protein
MPDMDPALAAKLGMQNGTRQRQARPPAAAAPLQVPVEVREQSKKPKRLQVHTSRVKGRDGQPVVIMTAASGFAISRVIFSEIDDATKKCRVAVITERRRGRPANSQRRGNGATQA